MSIAHYHSWGSADRLQNEMKQVFDRFLGADETDQSNVVTSQWTPRVDIREEEKRFMILADIPGVDPKDIEISMDKGILSIKGERKSEASEANAKLTRVERYHGVFYRRFALPDSADADGITASGKHGVLEIAIPKKPETTPRRININH
ncbi:MAG: Hsp20/alpha crystallin family protein [Rudaea sp.]|nr:Hsp20/alpha crystallin family protein [Rudaea sp.]